MLTDVLCNEIFCENLTKVVIFREKVNYWGNMKYNIFGQVEKINNDWHDVFSKESSQEYFQELHSFINQRSKEATIYPPAEDIFTAFHLTSLKETKVVIIGQDPYHGEGQAHGLSFSVPEGMKIPPSLRNMYKELTENFTDFEIPSSGNLESWAKQGVLLLNAVLTVEQSKAGSHQKKGWEKFTDQVVKYINDHQSNVVFILWGSYAQKKGKTIDRDKHFVLEGLHPSPLSAYRGFFGCQHFLKANEYLKSHGKEEVNWSLT